MGKEEVKVVEVSKPVVIGGMTISKKLEKLGDTIILTTSNGDTVMAKYDHIENNPVIQVTGGFRPFTLGRAKAEASELLAPFLKEWRQNLPQRDDPKVAKLKGQYQDTLKSLISMGIDPNLLK